MCVLTYGTPKSYHSAFGLSISKQAHCLAAWLTSLTSRRFMDTIVLPHKDFFAVVKKKKCLKFGRSKRNESPNTGQIIRDENMKPGGWKARFSPGGKFQVNIPQFFPKAIPKWIHPCFGTVNWVKLSPWWSHPNSVNHGTVADLFIRIHPKSPWMGPSSYVNVDGAPSKYTRHGYYSYLHQLS